MLKKYCPCFFLISKLYLLYIYVSYYIYNIKLYIYVGGYEPIGTHQTNPFESVNSRTEEKRYLGPMGYGCSGV